MTWVAYDRAGRLARDRGLPAPVEWWRKLAAAAHRYVQESCWDPELRSYVMYPGSKLLDASVLVMPLVKALGNFPQAFTHLALISAAVNLDRALDR